MTQFLFYYGINISVKIDLNVGFSANGVFNVLGGGGVGGSGL